MASAAQIVREWILKDQSGDAARSISANLDKIAASSAKAGAAAGQLSGAEALAAKAADAAALATGRSATATVSVERAFTRLQSRVDPLARAQEALARATATVTAAEERGIGTAEARGRVIDLATEKVKRLADAENAAARAAFEAVKSGVDPAAAAAQRYRDNIEAVARAERAGVVSRGEAARTLSQIKSQYEGAATGADRFRVSTGAAEGAMRLARAAAVALGAALSVRTIVAQTIEAQAADAQLRAAVASTGGRAGRTADQLGGQAERLQGTTTFDSEAIKKAQAQLLSFGNVRGPQFDKAIEATLDVAARKGKDLSEVSLALGKALNDPARGIETLRRAGVALSPALAENVRQLAAHGQVAQAQNLILDGLAKSFGGAAVAARGTFGGALTGLKNSFLDLLKLGPAATEPLRRAFEGIASALSSAPVKTAMAAIGTVVGQGLEGIVNSVKGRAAVVSAAFAKLFEGARPGAERALAILGRIDFSALLKAASDFGKTFDATIGRAFGAIGKIVGDLAPVVGGFVTNVLVPLGKMTFDGLRAALDLVGKGFDFIGQHAGIATGLVAAFAARAAVLASAQLLTGIGGIAAGFAGITKAVRDMGAALLANPLGLLATAIGAAVGAIVIFRNDIAKAVTGVADWRAAIQAVIEVLGARFGGVLAAAGEAFGDLIRLAQKAAEAAIAPFKAVAAAVALAFQGKFSEIGPAFAAEMKKGVDAGLAAVETAVRGAGDLVKTFKEASKVDTSGIGAAIHNRAAELAAQHAAQEKAQKSAGGLDGTLKALTETYKGVGEAAGGAAAGTDSYDVATGKANDSVDNQIKRMKLLTEAYARSYSEGRDLERGLDLLKDSAGENRDKATDLGRAWNEASDAFEKTRQAAQSADEQLKSTSNVLGNIVSSLGRSVADGLDNFLKGGSKDNANIGKSIGRSLRESIASELKKPIELTIGADIQGLLNKILGVAPGGLFNFGGYGSPAGGAGGLQSSLGGIFGGGGLSGLLTGLQSPALGNLGIQLGQLLGFSATGSGTVLSTLGSIGLNAPLGLLGNFAGGAISNIFGIKSNATNSNLGGTIGGLVGAALTPFLGPLGPLLGGVLGNIGGGLFGPKPTNAGVGLGFNPATGALFNEFNSNKGGSDENFAKLQAAVSALAGQTQGLAALGVQFTESVNAINIGSRDATNIWFNKLGEITANFTGEKRVDVSAVGDTEALSDAILKELLSTATSADESVKKLLAAGITDANQLTTLLGLFKQVDQLSGSAAAATSKYVQALQSQNAQIDQLASALAAAGGVAADELTKLNAARADLNARVIGDFVSEANTRLLNFSNPVLAKWQEMLKTEKGIVDEANAVIAAAKQYGKPSDVASATGALQADLAANALEQSQFLAGLSAADRAKLGLDTTALVTVTDRITATLRNLDEALNGDLTSRRDFIQQTKAQADQWHQLGAAITNAVNAQRDKYHPLPTSLQQQDLQSRFDTLYNEVVLNRNFSAAQALTQVGDQLLSIARERGASGKSFEDVYRDITSREAAAGDLANIIGTSADQALAAAQASVDIEQKILDALNGPSPDAAALAALNSALGATGPIATLLTQYLALQAELSGLPVPSPTAAPAIGAALAAAPAIAPASYDQGLTDRTVSAAIAALGGASPATIITPAPTVFVQPSAAAPAAIPSFASFGPPTPPAQAGAAGPAQPVANDNSDEIAALVILMRGQSQAIVSGLQDIKDSIDALRRDINRGPVTQRLTGT